MLKTSRRIQFFITSLQDDALLTWGPCTFVSDLTRRESTLIVKRQPSQSTTVFGFRLFCTQYL